ncbi:hypothetical protein [Deinococcus ruber]
MPSEVRALQAKFPAARLHAAAMDARVMGRATAAAGDRRWAAGSFGRAKH